MQTKFYFGKGYDTISREEGSIYFDVNGKIYVGENQIAGKIVIYEQQDIEDGKYRDLTDDTKRALFSLAKTNPALLANVVFVDQETFHCYITPVLHAVYEPEGASIELTLFALNGLVAYTLTVLDPDESYEAEA